MKRKIIYLVLLFIPQLVFCQNHDYIWWFEYQKRMLLNFNFNPPTVAVDNSNIDVSSYSTMITDSSGSDILFFSNGISIRNSLRQIMENGDSINFGALWLNNTVQYWSVLNPIALPYPGKQNHYLLIHTRSESSPTPSLSYFIASPIYYTEIDMKANNGLGKVVAKNQILLEGDVIWSAACKHGNGRDWWLVTAQKNNPDLLAYLLTPEGWQTPVVYHGSIDFPKFEWLCHSSFSPDGRYFIRNDGRNGARIYDFDRCDGTFSNMRYFEYDSLNPDFITWSAAFSEDSRYLFLSKLSMVWQVDMQADSLVMDTVMRWSWKECRPDDSYRSRIAMMQLAPDGKIYASASQGLAYCLTVIHQPTLPGIACDGDYGGYPLPFWNDGTLAHYPNYRLGELEGSPCDTLNGQRPGDGFVKSYPYEKQNPPNGYRIFRTYDPNRPPEQRRQAADPEEAMTPQEYNWRRLQQQTQTTITNDKN
jgi:hypothetical protein